MLKTKTKKMKVEVPESISCDKCKDTFLYGVDEMEIQEFHRINFVGGFTSIFGDEEHIKCDICQKCLHEMIKDIIQK